MSLEQASLATQIVAALAVVGSLIFLALQIRQNTKGEQLESLNVALNTHVGLIADITATDADAELFRKFVTSLESLSLNERGRAHALMLRRLASFNQVMFLHAAGALPQEEFEAIQGVFISIVRTKGGRRRWALFKHVVPPHVNAFVSDALDDPTIRLKAFDEEVPWLFNLA